MRNIADIIADAGNGKQLSQTERQIAVAYSQGKCDAVRELKLVNDSNAMEETEWIYERDVKIEVWTHTCGRSINDETMRLLWLHGGAKYCPFCGKPCTYDYTKRESEDEE